MAIASFFALTWGGLMGCNRDRPSSRDDTPELPASAITVANAFGVCEDVALCERECDAGSSDRCRRLGATYQFGQSVAKDETRAALLFDRACAMDNASSCVSAGQMYEYHHGVAKDDARAAGDYKKACDLGWAVGCANFAIMLENGRGVAKDEARALELYDDACAKGAGLACERAHVIRGARG